MIRLIVEGNAGNNPEIKFREDGSAWCRFSVAHTPRKKNQQTGRWEDAGETVWVTVFVAGRQAEAVSNMVTKGTKVRVEGMAEISVYDSKPSVTVSNALVTLVPVASRVDGVSHAEAVANARSAFDGAPTF